MTLDISGADRTVVQALEWELYDYNDIKIDNPAVRSKVKAVQATPAGENIQDGGPGHQLRSRRRVHSWTRCSTPCPRTR